MIPVEHARITYTIDTPPGSGSMGQLLVLPATLPIACERTLQPPQIRVLFSGKNTTMQFTLKGSGTAPFQSSLGASMVSSATAKVDFGLPLSFENGTGRMPVNFTTSSAADDLTCTIGLSVADPFADFSGDIMCQSGSNAMLRKLTLNGTFKAVPCPTQ